jgi:hypothetical protein
VLTPIPASSICLIEAARLLLFLILKRRDSPVSKIACVAQFPMLKMNTLTKDDMINKNFLNKVNLLQVISKCLCNSCRNAFQCIAISGINVI